VSDGEDPWIPCGREGKRLSMVLMFLGHPVVFGDDSDSPMGWEVFVPAGTLIAVKLLTWRNCRPSPTWINVSVCLSVQCLQVRYSAGKGTGPTVLANCYHKQRDDLETCSVRSTSGETSPYHSSSPHSVTVKMR